MPSRKVSSLFELKLGDHIETFCQLSQDKKTGPLNVNHHLLVISVVSENQLHVIHNDGTVVVEEETYDISPGEIIAVHDYPCKYTPKQTIQRARSQLGKEWQLLSDNCEHFVTWAKTGKGKSTQVLHGGAAAAGGGALGVAGGAAVGALIGSAVPVIGTFIGAGIGGVIGGVSGGFGGVFLYTHIRKAEK